MKVTRSIIPALFTVGNLFLGFYSVICSFNERISLACWFIIFAAILDTADGKVARLTKSSSRFGVEYDSLADVVSFGLAPSILMYTLLSQNPSLMIILICFLPLLGGSIRLARFNIQLTGFDKEYFVGLPIPMAAITLTSFILFSIHFYQEPLRHYTLLLLLIIGVSLLMVSTIRYEILPGPISQNRLRQILQIAISVLLLIAFILFPQQLLFPFTIAYILSGIIRWIFHLILSLSKGESVFESKH
jgi:CDP-diacylglycerol--serine O-phosphatidyltransferase